MKKITVLLFSIFAFFSCSGDSSSSNSLTTDGYLLKKSIVTNVTGLVVTTQYSYSGNKIRNAISSNGDKYEYTYTGDLITRLDYFVSNDKQYSDYYLYNSQQKLIQHKKLNFTDDTAVRTEFTYNSDNTVNVDSYSGDFKTQNYLISQRKAFLLPNDDVDKIESYVTVFIENHVRTQTYTYDTMNATSNSILGMNKLRLWDSGNNANSHNLLTVVYTTTENSSVNTAQASLNYNSYGFPITSNFSDGTSLLNSTQYFYQKP